MNSMVSQDKSREKVLREARVATGASGGKKAKIGLKVMFTSTCLVTLVLELVCASSPEASDGGPLLESREETNGTVIKLHETPWTVNGQPVLGTYSASRLEDLQRVKDVGMNVVFGDKVELDATTPEGRFCLENDIKVLYHLTSPIYHGVRLRDEVSANATNIPLSFMNGRVNQASHVIQLDDEVIIYEEMMETGLVNCRRGCNGTTPAIHQEGVILLWPEVCAAAVEEIKNSPNLYGYYLLDDSPGDAVSALRGLYQIIRKVDPDLSRPVCAGFGDAGSIANFAPGVCDIMIFYWYPVSSTSYHREQTSSEVQRMLSEARERVPGIPFFGIYQAFDGIEAQTGQGVPTPEQLREQMEDFVREGASGLISFLCYIESLPGWATIEGLAPVIREVNEEIRATGALHVRPETEAMKQNRIQPTGYWTTPQPLPGVVPAWNVLGPFADVNGEKLDAVYPPDEGVDENAVYPVKFGSARWRVWETNGGILGLSNIYGAAYVGDCTAYMFCDVTSPVTQTVQMRICSDDDALVKMNGKQIYRFDGSRGIEYDKDIVPLTLPEGKSRILVKVHNRKRSMWGLFMRFTDSQGQPLNGLEFSPKHRWPR